MKSNQKFDLWKNSTFTVRDHVHGIRRPHIIDVGRLGPHLRITEGHEGIHVHLVQEGIGLDLLDLTDHHVEGGLLDVIGKCQYNSVEDFRIFCYLDFTWNQCWDF